MPGKGLKGDPCVLCGRSASSRAGEHVLPNWLIRDLFPPDGSAGALGQAGPYLTYINGEVVRRKDDPSEKEISRPHFPRVNLPVCDGQSGSGCNGTLNSRFEDPAKGLVRKLFANQGRCRFNGQESEYLALWFLKTWLLYVHPSVRFEDAAEGNICRPWSHGPDFWTWMVGAGLPPDGLSMWMSILDYSAPEPERPPRVLLPEVVVDGPPVKFRVTQQALESLEFTVVYHPDWGLEHPLEKSGQAVRLWPQDNGSLDLTKLAPVPKRALAWIEGPMIKFRQGYFPDTRLPVLSDTLDLNELGLRADLGVQMVAG